MGFATVSCEIMIQLPYRTNVSKQSTS